MYSYWDSAIIRMKNLDLQEFLYHYESQGERCPIETSYLSPQPGVRYMFQKRMASILKLFDKQENKTLLDVGCGSGAYTYYFSNNKRSVVALDISRQYLLHTKRLVFNKPNVHLLRANAHCLPLKNEIFDYILCTEVIEHTIKPSKTLDEIARVLKKGGNCIISIPSRYSPTEIIRSRSSQYEHLHFWSVAQFRIMLRSRVLKILEVNHCLFLAYFLRYYLSKKPKLIPLINAVEDVFSRTPLLRHLGWCSVFKCVHTQ